MDPMFDSCAGLDVHKRSITACVRRLRPERSIFQETRTFGTMTRDILEMADWLTSEEVSHVVMESTGVYWKPIYNLLEDRFTVLLVNARHVKHVPGRKTDVQDCQWLAQLLQAGLLKGSFIPERPQRELRDLTRHRAQLVAEKTKVTNRLHKVLEDTNIKIGAVASDLLGASGRDMLRALIAGQQTPQEMANLARGQLREKMPQLVLALEGRVTKHHRFVLAELLDHLEDLERRIERFSRRIEEVSGPFDQAIQALMQLPGIERRGAENVVAEIGVTLDAFPSAAHLASWGGMCPGSNESAGKRKSGKTTKGSRWLRAALCQAAWAATRKKDSYFQAQYRRLAGRRGKKRALVAVGHSLLVVIYHILKDQLTFKDLGADYFERLNVKRLIPKLVKRLENFGYEVNLTPLMDAA
jgi:transposase